MNKKIKHKVAILGCGNIGALYDIQRNLKKSPLSHLEVILRIPILRYVQLLIMMKKI